MSNMDGGSLVSGACLVATQWLWHHLVESATSLHVSFFSFCVVGVVNRMFSLGCTSDKRKTSIPVTFADTDLFNTALVRVSAMYTVESGLYLILTWYLWSYIIIRWRRVGALCSFMDCSGWWSVYTWMSRFRQALIKCMETVAYSQAFLLHLGVPGFSITAWSKRNRLQLVIINWLEKSTCRTTGFCRSLYMQVGVDEMSFLAWYSASSWIFDH